MRFGVTTTERRFHVRLDATAPFDVTARFHVRLDEPSTERPVVGSDAVRPLLDGVPCVSATTMAATSPRRAHSASPP